MKQWANHKGNTKFNHKHLQLITNLTAKMPEAVMGLRYSVQLCQYSPIIWTWHLQKRQHLQKEKGKEFYQIVPLFQLPPPAKALQKKKINSKYRCYLYSLWSAYKTKLIDEEYSQRDSEVLYFYAVCSIFYKCLLAQKLGTKKKKKEEILEIEITSVLFLD